ncbi:MAG: NUDIX domain-containing protein [Micromonosporaceae bacterium]
MNPEGSTQPTVDSTGPAAASTRPATHDYRVLQTRTQFSGRVFDVVTDTVAMPGGGSADRDYVRHVGAVGVVALDDGGRVVMVRQYRHPVRQALWELPAGLIDVPGEDPLPAAQRELAEEADLAADRWDLLVDLHTTPGCSDESIRVYLARGLRPAPESGHVPSDEEAELTVSWFDLDDAAEMALRGEVTNGPAVAGVLAAVRAQARDWSGLRSASAPRPGRTARPGASPE